MDKRHPRVMYQSRGEHDADHRLNQQDHIHEVEKEENA
jgi:hypothetical protein